ncbi:hypothetical protein N7540_005835 [Penicillium herquei]|nr:hypothetical protein N7540_005835 [Penicillium herquei]
MNRVESRARDQSAIHYVIPSLENQHFTGRESTLDELKQKLFKQASVERLALFGLGGIGKTQVALQLTRWVKADVPDCSIFWAPALSLESFEQACSQIAKELQIPQNIEGESVMESVQRQLSSDKAGKWLFIVDNADEKDLLFNKLNQYFPISNNGVTLLTTRSHEIALSGTTTRYLQLMHKTEKDRMSLASREFYDRTRYRGLTNALATTWLISFKQIQGFDPSAANLLEFISYLEPKRIPRSILPTLDLEEKMEYSIGTLCSYGFLIKRGNENMFDVHSLVQLSTRLWITDTQKTQQIIATLTQHIDKCFPSNDYANRDTWRTYLPHALKILRREEVQRIKERYTLLSKVGKCILADGRAKAAVVLLGDVCTWNESEFDEDHPSRLASQHNLARAYNSNGQIKQAVELLEHVVTVQDKTLDEDHPDRLASQHELAWAYNSNGQIKQAVELLEHVVTVRDRTLDEDHPDRLASQHNLAVAYNSNGQIKQAVELLEHVVAVRDRTLDEDHPDRLASQHNLAVAYNSNGQIKQAVELLEHVVAVRDRTLDEDHPDRLASQHNLAVAYNSNGQIKQAVELLEHVVTVQDKTLDGDHPDRLASQRALQSIKKSIKVATMENIFLPSPP